MDAGLGQFILFLITGLSAIGVALWLGMIIWTYRDMRQRSRDSVATLAATVMVLVLNVAGLILYLMLRPRETLAEAYERSLEEESLLQGIEEKPVCPGCGRPSQSRWQVCPYCHTRLKKPCVNCGELLELPWALCPVCVVAQPAYEADPGQMVELRSQRAFRPTRGEKPRPPKDTSSLEYIEE
jgi:hypothetical protein